MELADLSAYKSYRWIVADPRFLGGSPAIRGTRYPVSHLLESLAAGSSYSEIGQTYSIGPIDEAIREALLLAAEAVRSFDTADSDPFTTLAASLTEEKPANWRSLLLAALLPRYSEQVNSFEIDFSYGLGSGNPRIRFDSDADLFGWFRAQSDVLADHLGVLRQLLFFAYPSGLDALDEVDVVPIVKRLSQRIGAVWVNIWLWKLSYQDVVAEDRFRTLLDIAPKMADGAIGRLARLAEHLVLISEGIVTDQDVPSREDFIAIDIPDGLSEAIANECERIGSSWS